MTMKITGYKLKEMIKRAEMVRDTVASLFSASLFKFEDETKDSPQKVVEKFQKADLALAQLQTIQARYNLTVEVDVLGEKMTLMEAVKRVGGAGRVEKMWRSASGEKRDRYSSYRDENMTRDKNEIRATATLNKSQALELAQEAAKVAGALRAAIAEGNSREVELDVSLPDF
jgi:hypothetical protein